MKEREEKVYVHMTFFKAKGGKMDQLRKLYFDEVIPASKAHNGIRFVHLLECLDSEHEGISITAWDKKGDLEEFQKSEDFERMRRNLMELFADEPVPKSYQVTASSEPLILRIF